MPSERSLHVPVVVVVALAAFPFVLLLVTFWAWLGTLARVHIAPAGLESFNGETISPFIPRVIDPSGPQTADVLGQRLWTIARQLRRGRFVGYVIAQAQRERPRRDETPRLYAFAFLERGGRYAWADGSPLDPRDIGPPHRAHPILAKEGRTAPLSPDLTRVLGFSRNARLRVAAVLAWRSRAPPPPQPAPVLRLPGRP